ncbi:MAG: bifunctional oligoribonuclease/PAP phosphatase NrnA [Balneolaceae bacterium]|nr:MAG: bifunctional oligoribonuclease/PAP phosphatase NrnA [Balneolaceae bacterium]
MFESFLENIGNYKQVGVVSHVRPDGDCTGSQIALCRWLRSRGIEARAFNDDELPDNLIWLQKSVVVEKPSASDYSECDLIILVDGNAPHRFGLLGDWLKEHDTPLWMIDHHPDPEDRFELSISQTDASSTAEMIFNLFMEDDPNLIDEETAKALYTGIITDTGSLQFESVTPATVEAVAELLRRGQFRPNEVIERIYSNRTPEQLRLLSRALHTIELHADNQLSVMTVTREMLSETGASPADCDGFVSYPLNMAGIKAAFLLKDFYDDGIRISLRSRSSLDVNQIARNFGGGGHKKAAGAWHSGPPETTVKELVGAAITQLKAGE